MLYYTTQSLWSRNRKYEHRACRHVTCVTNNQCGQPFRGARVIILLLLKTWFRFSFCRHREPAKNNVFMRNYIIMIIQNDQIYTLKSRQISTHLFGTQCENHFERVTPVRSIPLVAHPVWAGALAPNIIIDTAVAGAMAFVALLSFSVLATNTLCTTAAKFVE